MEIISKNTRFTIHVNREEEKISKNDTYINFATEIDENEINVNNNKNQFIAMGLSAILPGTGQIYNGDWKRGVGYLGIEILLWSFRKNYKTR